MSMKSSSTTGCEAAVVFGFLGLGISAAESDASGLSFGGRPLFLGGLGLEVSRAFSLRGRPRGLSVGDLALGDRLAAVVDIARTCMDVDCLLGENVVKPSFGSRGFRGGRNRFGDRTFRSPIRGLELRIGCATEAAGCDPEK